MSVFGTLLFALLFFMQGELIFAQTNEDLDDPEYWRANGYVSEEFLDDDTVENKVYEARTPGMNTQTVVRFGVDVSKYQGEIDWTKAKENGAKTHDSKMTAVNNANIRRKTDTSSFS